MFQPFMLTHIAGVKNVAADVVSRHPAGQPDKTMDGADTMLTGAGTTTTSTIMDTALTKPCPKEWWGAQICHAIMMGGLELISQETDDRPIPDHYTKLKVEEHQEEEDEWVTGTLQMATGVISKREDKAITQADIRAAAQFDSEYKTLVDKLTNKLPWGDGCKEYRQHKSRMLAANGVAFFEDRVIIPKGLRSEVMELLHVGLEGEKAKMALLEYRNTPHRDSNTSTFLPRLHFLYL